MIVELCASNDMASYIDLLESEGFDVVAYSCLDRCELCILRPFAFADGQLLETADPDSLLSLLRAMKAEEDALAANDDDW